MNRLRKILLSCSGAVESVLAEPECRADAKKYAMIGTFVLLTAVFAFFSSTFALYTGIGSLPIAIALGMAWAIMIFTLDRFVVSGIRKKDVEGLPPAERFKTRLVEWLVAIPRLALAALISFVVATPLELRFFQREINAQLEETHAYGRQTARNNLDREFDEINALRTKNAELRASSAEAWKNHNDAESLASQELAGRALTGRSGAGPVYHRLKAQADDLRTRAEQTAKENAAMIASNDTRIAELERERRGRRGRIEGAIDTSDGFLARYRALGEMADKNPDIRSTRIFFTLLFLTIELTPVVMKLLQRRGPYDDLIDTLEHKVRVLEMIQRSHINDDAHTQVTDHSRENSEKIALAETLSHETYQWDTLSRVAAAELEKAQTTLARAAINEWLRKEMLALGTPPRSRTIPIRKPPRQDEPPGVAPS